MTLERLSFLQEVENTMNYESIVIPIRKTICSKNAETPWVYTIKSGIVKVYDVTTEGQKKTLLLLQPGESFPMIWAFDHPVSTRYSYECMAECTLYRVNYKDFKQTLATDANFTQHALEMFVNLTWDLMERVKCLQMPYTYEKLVRAIPYLAAKAGTRVNQLVFSLPKWITQDEIAQLLGTSRESITAHIKSARELGLFTSSENGLKVDLSKIEDQYIYARWFE